MMYKTGVMYIGYTEFRYGIAPDSISGVDYEITYEEYDSKTQKRDIKSRVSGIPKDALKELTKAVEYLESWEDNENSI